MKTFAEWLLSEITDIDKDFLSNKNIEIIDKLEQGEHSMYLLKRREGIYEVALASSGGSFTDRDQVMSRRPNWNFASGVNALQPMIAKMTEWVQKYEPLFIGSANPRKVLKYESILRGLGFHVEKIEPGGNYQTYLKVWQKNFDGVDSFV